MHVGSGGSSSSGRYIYEKGSKSKSKGTASFAEPLPAHGVEDRGSDHSRPFIAAAPFVKNISDRISDDGCIVLPGNFSAAEAEQLEKPRRAIVVRGPVNGLALSRVSPEFARSALIEIRQHFQRRRSISSASTMYEIGWSFHALEDEGVMRMVLPLHDFPSLRALIEEAMLIFNGRSDIREEALNIICRRYSKGQSLPKHRDRVELFDSLIYGCVLHNTSDQVLTFTREARGGEEVDDRGPHRIDEQPGVCFQQSGEARYEWNHGVETLKEGERISVTWRWIIDGVANKGSADNGKSRATPVEKLTTIFGHADQEDSTVTISDATAPEEALRKGRRWARK